MDTTQLLLNAVLTVSTLLLVIVGIQLIFVLKEIRLTLKKIGGIIDTFEKVAGSVEHGFSEVLGFLAGVKTLFKIIDIFHSKKSGKSKDT